MEALQAICNPDLHKALLLFFWIDAAGKEHPFFYGKWLSDFGKSLGLYKFFDGDSFFLLDAYCYNALLWHRNGLTP